MQKPNIYNVYYTYDSAGKLVSMNISTKVSETSWSAPTEYFYVRNAQGDIIGLIDKVGTQVVAYNYDSWGKMTPSKAEIDDASDTNKNGITGTLKDTVGVKNPYRYRGYRYDTETGLYYLQSRYYNPEWGRFINTDALGGSVGELLSHNVFAYCKNNPVTAKDPSGFRPVYTMDEETDAMREASLTAMNTSASNKSSYGGNNNQKMSVTVDEVVGIGTGFTKNSVLGGAGYALDILSEDKILVFNRKMERAGEYLYIPGSKAAKIAGKGLIVLDFGVSIATDIRESKSRGELIGKCTIDTVSTVLSVAAGVVFTPVGGAVVGVGIGLIADGFKSWLW